MHVSNLTPEGRRRGREKGHATVVARADARAARTRELLSDGWPVWRISRELGLARTTVYRYLRD